MNTAAYVKVKKLGIGRALGAGVFPGGEAEMLERIEITGFEIIGKEVVTKFRINRIPTSTVPTSGTSGNSIITAISTTSFKSDVLTHTITAISDEPASAWTASGSIFSSAPTDANGASTTSLFVSNDTSTAISSVA